MSNVLKFKRKKEKPPNNVEWDNIVFALLIAIGIVLIVRKCNGV